MRGDLDLQEELLEESITFLVIRTLIYKFNTQNTIHPQLPKKEAIHISSNYDLILNVLI